ncbi:hypothetical protein SAMN05216353_102102 [Halobacillus alkaliphilus]|uniref:Uncharacterized protein n=1 Tax=Halobacillus alkaliphilus TaxID=396056 RepID=A0A1I2JRW5_9BACI|nr:hypothetical protein [Halobacillus alkaliphilus]SFF57685.1 hypothetical protein SAMN05216353_102102 [Halobacillus alkaliphilus]
MKKFMGVISVIVIVAVLFFILNKTTMRTLGELIHNELPSSQVISEIYISSVGDEFTIMLNRLSLFILSS